MKIHHIGYLVKNLQKSKEEFCKLGYNVISEDTHDTIRHVDICFIEKDKYVIELVAPYDNESVVAEMLKKYKNMPYHICYNTDDLKRDAGNLAENGYVIIGEASPAPALGGKRVEFLLNPKLGMIELLET